MSKFTFVLKDKGTSNQGWWLKISNIDQLAEYYETIVSSRNAKVFENYIYSKDWNWAHPLHPNKDGSHAPHLKETPITEAIVQYASNKNISILEGILGFQAMVIDRQIREILETGAIYINSHGGYHSYYHGDKEYAFVHRNAIIFPEYTRNEIKISQFPGGEHYYAHIGDLEVRDGDTIKWNTYEEAYKQALSFMEK